jgi:hypothetical protein
MSAAAIVGIIIALIVLGVVAWYLVVQRRRTEDLRARYGPEYSRTVDQIGDRGRAEAELVKRQERVEALDIRPLSAEQRGKFTQDWRSVQALFVDDPRGAITRADGLVEEVMKVRGYPVSISVPPISRSITAAWCRTIARLARSPSAIVAAWPRPKICVRRWSTTASCSRTSSRIAST